MDNNFDNMEDILKQIDIIKRRLRQMENELENTNVKGRDERSGITVIYNGKNEIIDIVVPDDKLEQNLKAGLIAALNNGLKNSTSLKTEKKQEILGEIDLPNIPGLF